MSASPKRILIPLTSKRIFIHNNNFNIFSKTQQMITAYLLQITITSVLIYHNLVLLLIRYKLQVQVSDLS
jgi:hypothetical protein